MLFITGYAENAAVGNGHLGPGMEILTKPFPMTTATLETGLDPAAFNPKATLPYSLRLKDFQIAMQDVYDFFYDVNGLLLQRGLHRMDDMLRPAAMSGMISDMLTASMAKHARFSSRISTSMAILI